MAKEKYSMDCAGPVDYDLPRGSPIPGSALIRDYCRGCGEPIRVNEDARLATTHCSACGGPTGVAGKPRGRIAQDDTPNIQGPMHDY